MINTGTTIVTFLMFVIQNTQNRDKAATQIKLDELIRVTEKLDLEELGESWLERLRRYYARLAEEAHARGTTLESV